MKILITIFLLVGSVTQAAEKIGLIRRLAVFPIACDPQMNQIADGTWIDMREELTKNQRFLVASRSFLVNKDVFQPRRELKNVDAIVLGRALDAQAIITIFVTGREMQMQVHNGADGTMLWESRFQMQPSIPIQEQLNKAGMTLVRSFIASLPFSGFQALDSYIGQALIEKDGKLNALVNLGLNSGVQVGDEVDWIEMERSGLAPLFQGGAKVTVVAHGKVTSVNENTANVVLERFKNKNLLADESIVRIPRLIMAAADKPKGDADKHLSLEIVTSDMLESEKSKQQKPLYTAISIVASVVGFLLLAF